jgi:hypothetical protein
MNIEKIGGGGGREFELLQTHTHTLLEDNKFSKNSGKDP